jgi:hypothetical protein
MERIYETCAEFPMYIPYSNNYRNLARRVCSWDRSCSAIVRGTRHQGSFTKCRKIMLIDFIIGKQKRLHWTRFLEGATQCKTINQFGLNEDKTTFANPDTYQTIKHDKVESNCP